MYKFVYSFTFPLQFFVIICNYKQTYNMCIILYRHRYRYSYIKFILIEIYICTNVYIGKSECTSNCNI